MEETQALHHQIVAEIDAQPVPITPVQNLNGHPQVLQQLQLAMREFDQAQSRLRRAIQLVDRFIKTEELEGQAAPDAVPWNTTDVEDGKPCPRTQTE